jgi:Spy/CpxP family protein refolding chaperone
MTNSKRLLASGVAAMGAAAVAFATQASLNVKLGLWETHTQAKMTGDVAAMLPESQMQNMTPEQRAKMQQIMQQAMASMQKPHYGKQCMTAEKLAKGFDTSANQNSNCKNTVTTNTSTQFESHLVCSGAGAEGTSATIHVSAQSPEHVIGTVISDQSSGGKGLAFSATFEGKWLSSDCGTVKDWQEEPAPK